MLRLLCFRWGGEQGVLCNVTLPLCYSTWRILSAPKWPLCPSLSQTPDRPPQCVHCSFLCEVFPGFLIFAAFLLDSAWVRDSYLHWSWKLVHSDSLSYWPRILYMCSQCSLPPCYPTTWAPRVFLWFIPINLTFDYSKELIICKPGDFAGHSVFWIMWRNGKLELINDKLEQMIFVPWGSIS